MLKGKWKILICIALVTCVVFTASNNVFAAINDSYIVDTPVADANLDDKIGNSPLLEAIGSFIYAVGSLMEWVLGKAFQLITGTNMFPWADQILFNAVPFLDINIFTGAENSLVSILYDFLTGTYYSLLTLASTFFGIAVMFSAIKLAITAIAEDKAKYKKAIVDWILGLVMLWGIHFFISFVLYLNEQLVVVASNIVSESLAEAGDKISELADTSSYNEKIVGNFVNLMEKGGFTFRNVLEVIVAVGGAILVAVAFVGLTASGAGFAAIVAASVKLIAGVALVAGARAFQVADLVHYAEGFLTMSRNLENAKGDEGNALANETENYEKACKWIFSTSCEYEYDEVTYTYSPIDVCAALLKSDAYSSTYLSDIAEDEGFFTLKKAGTKAQVARLFYDASTLVGEIEYSVNPGDAGRGLAYDWYKLQLATFDSIPIRERTSENYDADLYALYSTYCNIIEQYVLKQKSEKSVIYNLATYFKETSFEVSETGWKASKSVIQNAIMYVLLVCYSLVFFISYTKRLFYVIMLILMAPMVVVFDFFMKFGK